MNTVLRSHKVLLHIRFNKQPQSSKLIDIVSPADQLLNWNIFTIIFYFFMTLCQILCPVTLSSDWLSCSLKFVPSIYLLVCFSNRVGKRPENCRFRTIRPCLLLDVDTYPAAGWTAIPRQCADVSLTMDVVKEAFISDT